MSNTDLQTLMQKEMESASLPSGATLVFNCVKGPTALSVMSEHVVHRVEKITVLLNRMKDSLAQGTSDLDNYFKLQEEFFDNVGLAQADLDLISSLIRYKTEHWKQSQKN